MLTSVEHSPSHLTGIPFQQMGFHAAAIQKFEDLAIRLDQSPATARIDLVATVCTEFDPVKLVKDFYTLFEKSNFCPKIQF